MILLKLVFLTCETLQAALFSGIFVDNANLIIKKNNFNHISWLFRMCEKHKKVLLRFSSLLISFWNQKKLQLCPAAILKIMTAARRIWQHCWKCLLTFAPFFVRFYNIFYPFTYIFFGKSALLAKIIHIRFLAFIDKRYILGVIVINLLTHTNHGRGL